MGRLPSAAAAKFWFLQTPLVVWLSEKLELQVEVVVTVGARVESVLANTNDNEIRKQEENTENEDELYVDVAREVLATK